MIAWTIESNPFTVPSGRIDIYHSLQRIEPGGSVAAHTHAGPESGVVVSGTLARFEDGETRAYSAGERFLTRAGIVHTSGNSRDVPAEAFTLHIVTAGSPFSTPCECVGAPKAAPGSTNPTRSIFRDLPPLAMPRVAEHALHRVETSEHIEFRAPTLLLVTCLEGTLVVNDTTLSPAGCAIFSDPLSVVLASAEQPARALLAHIAAHG